MLDATACMAAMCILRPRLRYLHVCNTDTSFPQARAHSQPLKICAYHILHAATLPHKKGSPGALCIQPRRFSDIFFIVASLHRPTAVRVVTSVSRGRRAIVSTTTTPRSTEIQLARVLAMLSVQESVRIRCLTRCGSVFLALMLGM